MSNNTQIEQVELSIEQAKGAIDTMKSMISLRDNKDFKAIIEEGYFAKEASRLVLLRADSQMQDKIMQQTINDQITAVGYFRQYLSTIFQLGRMAETAVANDEKTLEELNAEGLEQ